MVGSYPKKIPPSHLRNNPVQWELNLLMLETTRRSVIVSPEVESLFRKNKFKKLSPSSRSLLVNDFEG
jgi:hypothetical protein